jgi:hypothetical protein
MDEGPIVVKFYLQYWKLLSSGYFNNSGITPWAWSHNTGDLIGAHIKKLITDCDLEPFSPLAAGAYCHNLRKTIAIRMRSAVRPFELPIHGTTRNGS